MRDLAIATFPLMLGQNPYQRLLLDALAERGVRNAGEHLEFKPGLPRRASAEGISAIHLHWLEFLYHEPGRGPRSAALIHKRAALVALTLRDLRRSGVRVVWTVHNLRPHETRFPRLTDGTIRAGLRASDAVVVHSEHAARRLTETFRVPVAPVVLPHPNYSGVYPPARRGREVTRRDLGLPHDAFVFLMFGQIRPYKRIPEAIALFRSVPDRSARLLIAGRAPDQELARTLRKLAARDPRICLVLESVAEDDVADLHAAADMAFLHYRDVFSSGALMLAFTLGLPVLAPANNTAEEVAGPPALESYTDADAVGVLDAIAGADPAGRREAALRVADAHPWSAMADGLRPLLAG